jgi:hypothetical protein
MAATDVKPPIATAKNGIVAPVYFDRQIVRAADLNLGRANRDAELARMRRYLHGWGVVAGLIPLVREGALLVYPGYGVTLTGDEVLLTELVKIGEILGRIWGCCGPGKLSCEVVDEEEIHALAAEAEKGEVEGWLIARPIATASDPRPGIPEGCEHPANKLLPTRACGGVSLELLCEVPKHHLHVPARCEDLIPYICRAKGAPPEMLPMPDPPEPGDNFLVLGKLTATREDVTFSAELRRRLLPVSLLQDWLASCLCPIVTAPLPAPPPPDDSGDDTDGDTEHDTDGGDPGGVVGGGFLDELDWRAFEELLRLRERVPLPLPPIDTVTGLPGVVIGAPRPGVVDPPEPDAVFGTGLVDILVAGDVGGPAAFLAKDTAELVALTGMTEVEIERHKREIENMARFARPGAF